MDVVRWEELPCEAATASAELTGSPPQHGKAILDNISVSGAGLVVPTWTNMRPGQALSLELHGTWGPVRVVRIEATAGPTLIYCGVTFETRDPTFHARVAEFVGGRPAPASRYWD
ncbi:MAG: hypothetical protein JWN46_388 [Acidimicrobiales bacterium]|nr:hypothetical protein [Acidimicrobiales bacterium]